MERRRWALILPAIACIVMGCSKGQDGEVQISGDAAPAELIVGPTPEAAVKEFLEAVKSGNDDRASFMLSDAARQKTTEMEMVVAPPGSATATYEVGDVEYVTEDKDGAHVASKWTDLQDGESHTDEIIWILRKEAVGWRIAGMATKIFDDELPLILNFEDPEDMLRKQKLAQEELERRESQDLQVRQSAKPGETHLK